MSPAPVPVTVLAGGSGGAVRERVLQLLRARAPGEPWAVVVDGAFAAADLAGALADPEVRVVASGGCACCTGAPLLRVTLVRLLRERRWRRILLVAGADARLPALEALLREPAFDGHLVVDPASGTGGESRAGS